MQLTSHEYPLESRRAFTLIELVLVMAVLGVLIAVSWSVLGGGAAKSKVDRAKADIQVIQQGLESYKVRFGDYPKIPSLYTGLGTVDTPEEYLLNALCGRIGPAHQVVSGIPSMLNTSVLDYQVSGLPLTSLQSNWILDPWGAKYIYDYRPEDNDWVVFGYTLRSMGPDGAIGTEDDVISE